MFARLMTALALVPLTMPAQPVGGTAPAKGAPVVELKGGGNR